jgi:hypothetical protein
MNGCIIESGEAFDWSAGGRGSTFRISAFQPTAMLLWEPDEKIDNYFNDGASSPGEGFSRRHSVGAIVGSMGGHVRFLKWEQYYQLLADPNKNELWCFPRSANGR